MVEKKAQLADQLKTQEIVDADYKEIDKAQGQLKHLNDQAEALKVMDDHLAKSLDAASANEKAAVALKEELTPGGISMSDKNLTINIKVDGDGMPLAVQFQDPAIVNIQGLLPVIRDIAPISQTNMPVLSELMKMKI
jgi:hypothetical protein